MDVVLNKIKAGVWPINQLLMFWGMLSILVVILKFSSDLLVPFLIAVALSIVLLPLLKFFQNIGIPKVIALLILVVAVLIPTIILGGYIGEEVKLFVTNFSETKQQFNASLEHSVVFLNRIGISVSESELQSMLQKSNFTEIVKSLASQAGTQFSNVFLIFFTVSFMLMESEFLYNKMMKIVDMYGGDIDNVMLIIKKIKSYFLLKVKTSLITGLWIYAVLWYYDVEYAYLWAVLTFFLNFIPVVGSIIAAFPPIVMTFIDQNAMTALWIAVWYMIVNTVIGNILEPRIMGRGLGLSALVIFLSMTFWGWVFGPTGMILSAPLTMIAQFLFAQYKETEWVAIMLSDYEKNPMTTKDDSTK